jgi:hypothetical protein
MRYLDRLSYKLVILIPCGDVTASEMSVHIKLGADYSFSRDLTNYLLSCLGIYLHIAYFNIL